MKTTKQIMCNDLHRGVLAPTNMKSECVLLYFNPKREEKFKKACSFWPLNNEHMPIYVLLRVHFTALNQAMHSALRYFAVK